MPLGCGNNGPNVGINSTPVIDVAAQALYVVAYTLMSGIPTYQVFALNLSDLTDKISPVTVAASHTLSDGTTYNFNAQFQRQRAALLESSGIIYADLPVSAISPPTSRVAGSWDGRPARWLRSRRTR